MEENKTKIFWRSVDGGELKELECVAKSDCFEFEPLEEPIDVKYDPTPITMSFDMKMTPNQFKSIHKLFKMRIPRKLKKQCKKVYADYFKVNVSKVRMSANHMMYHK